MKVINDNNFADEIKEGVTLVDFYADWCGPCKMIAPFLEQVEQEVSDAKIVKINVDDSPETAQKYNVMSIPTLILFKDGEIVNQKMGFMSKEQIVALIDEAK